MNCSDYVREYYQFIEKILQNLQVILLNILEIVIYQTVNYLVKDKI